MANPPFAGDIKETRILAKYELARTVSLDKISKVDENDPNIEDATRAPRPSRNFCASAMKPFTKWPTAPSAR